MLEPAPLAAGATRGEAVHQVGDRPPIEKRKPKTEYMKEMEKVVESVKQVSEEKLEGVCVPMEE